MGQIPFLRTATAQARAQQSRSMDEIIMDVRNASIWKLFSNFYGDMERLTMLNLEIDVFKQFETTVNSEPSRSFYHLYSLEQRLGDGSGVDDVLLATFEQRVEELFQPLPSREVMKSFGDDLCDLLDSTFHSDEFTLHDWGRAYRMPNSKDHKQLHDLIKDKSVRDAFLDELQRRILVKKKPYEQYIVLRWFFNGLLRAADEGKFGFLGIRELAEVQACVERKTQFYWATPGWLVYQLLEYGAVSPRHFTYGKTASLFQELVTVTVPQFVLQLTELKGIMEAQHQRVADLQNQAMAAAVAGAVSAAQFFIKWWFE